MIAIDVLVACLATAHVILTKRDTRAAIAWIGLLWLTPIIGAVLYFWLGVNRIRRRARSLRSNYQHPVPPRQAVACRPEELEQVFGVGGLHLRSVSTLIQRVTERPLLAGNHVQPLIDGDQAFPAMLEAIDRAERCISLSTYILDDDVVGRRFLSSLAAAAKRGVAVRVLIDDMGARYSWPTMVNSLQRSGVTCSTFMPPLVPWRFQYSNLRNHRKTLVVDGRWGFAGGINIREGHALQIKPKYPVRDVHFQITGPVVSQIQESFVDDWSFSHGEVLDNELWFPHIEPVGQVLARGISDGPDEHFESFRLALLGAIAAAENSVRIVTPYFLPDSTLISALNVAALRGIAVDIVLPSENNIAIVHWAMMAHLPQLLERGCRIWFSPPPFDHTKLMVVDGLICFLGSSNWDPRSLRLNFEFNLECYDRNLAHELTQIIDHRIARARLFSLDEWYRRATLLKLRDGVARLLSPYL